MPAADSTTAIEAAYRVEFPRVVAVLAAFTGDIALAEDLAQDALADALRQWPQAGTPDNPGAWLTAVGKRKAIDNFRRQRSLAAKYALIGDEQQDHSADDWERMLGTVSGEHIDDDRLRLIFVACHPVLALPARVALTLRLIGGLTVPEIARAYVLPEATIAQRIVRAKKTIARAGIPFEVPIGEDRASRLAAVLEVIYLIFNEGYSATTGDDWVRPELCGEALRLGRVLAFLTPDEPEVHGLVALWSSSRPVCAPASAPPAHRSCSSTRTAACGIASTSPGARPLSPGPDNWPLHGAFTPCRPPSPLAMPAPSGPRKPTGSRSSTFTPNSPAPRHRRSSS